MNAAEKQLFFIFDVESVGLHGEGFAVAGGLYDNTGTAISEFAYHCKAEIAKCRLEDLNWVRDNVTISPKSVEFSTPWGVRDAFWNVWMMSKCGHKAQMFVECGWPVEANFLAACVNDHLETRNWDGPYPMHEIASVMLAAGMDPMATYERQPNELPAHEPLADARLSARLLSQALATLNTK